MRRWAPAALALAVLALVTLQLVAAPERAVVGKLTVRVDAAEGTFAAHHEGLGVLLRGSLPAIGAGGETYRPSADGFGAESVVVADGGGPRGFRVTYRPAKANDVPTLVYALDFPPTGDGLRLSARADRAAGEISVALRAFTGCGDRPLLCRLEPGEHPEVAQVALGRVSGGLADSLFDRDSDTAVTFAAPTRRPALTWNAEEQCYAVSLTATGRAGQAIEVVRATVTRDLFRSTRGITHYAPIGKSAFATPPNGWCSWHYYYGSISEEEMCRNTDWLAEHLKPFGLEYVQLDDGYQTSTWTDWNGKFPHGGKWLAEHIHDRGLKAGLWLTPFAQGSQEVADAHPEWFLRDAEGKAVGTFAGPFTVDASSGAVLGEWFRPLFGTLAGEWGFDYLKIDGQPTVTAAYLANRERLSDPGADPIEAYRAGLSAIRKAIGDERYLLGCWGIPLEGIGLMNGGRTGGDVGADWGGFQPAINATMEWYFLHNIAWHCDPDCVLVREPLTLDQARAWATLVGITGQHLMSGDQMYDLPEQRVELLRRIYPAADIRPMDLYRYPGRPRIWDLKIANEGEAYDVVAVFNWDEEPQTVDVDFAALGLDAETEHAVYEFWEEGLIGALRGGFSAALPPTCARVYAVKPIGHRPLLLSTSRHVTQGALDLHDVRWSEGGDEVTGRSDVVGGDAYTITVFLPAAPAKWSLEGATAEGADVTAETDGVLARVTLRSAESGTVAWRLTFTSARETAPTATTPTGPKAASSGD